MRVDTAVDRVKRELHRSLDVMRGDLDRVEILAAALGAFSKPVPNYEPTFRHLRHLVQDVHELG